MSSTDLMNVSAFKDMTPDAAFAALNPQEESLADGIGAGYAVVGYKGKVWSLRHRGESHTFVRPDDGSPLAFLDVIILRSPAVKAKSYYPEGSYAAEASSGKPPHCASIDGVTPDAGVPHQQAVACAICPRNEWKVNAEGHKGRECSDYKRLAVLILPNLTQRLLGAALMEPVFLRVPAASLSDLATFGNAMADQGFHYSTFVTRIGFMADKSHPQMTFRALQKLTAAEAPVVMPMRNDPMALRITGEDEIGNKQAAPAQVNGPDLAAQQAAAQQAAAQAARIAQEKAAAEAAAKARAAEADQPVETGFGNIGSVSATTIKNGFTSMGNGAFGGALESGGMVIDNDPIQTTIPTTQTAADTGPVEDADGDLDSQVAALLKT